MECRIQQKEIIQSEIKKYPFWEHLSAQEKQMVENGIIFRNYQKKETVQIGSESCMGLIRIQKGLLRTYMLSEEGREITLFRIEEGNICALSASCAVQQITFETNIVAEEDTKVMLIPSGILSYLMDENIYVKCYVYEQLVERFSSVMWTMQQILFLRYDQRLAGFLLSEAERTDTLEIVMTHEQIATAINSAREVVERMLKRFVSDGYVQLKRGRILIKDKEALKSLME